jgi:Ala-tRNA(Pro) deacylase
MLDPTATVADRLLARLAQGAADHAVLRHAPVYTSAEAAAVRGSSLASGAKALVVSADGVTRLLVLPADCKLDGRALRRQAGVKKLRFLDRDELFRQTGLEPGAVPPFGSLFGLETWCDRRLAVEPEINFNAGAHDVSVRLAWTDYLRLEQPRLLDFAEPPATAASPDDAPHA